MDAPLDEAAVLGPLRGVAASRGCAIGPARLVREASELALVQPGEVAVLRCAWPAASQVLGRVAAIVAERGGPLCNLGTLAREYEVPCLLATNGALGAIGDGATVFVDADAGCMTVIGS